MILTDEQRKAVEYNDNSLVIACPGSGKTRTLIAKLLSCLEIIRGTARKIACITYTNAAVYEIEYRLRKYGKSGDSDYCEISTIHSFCLDNILRYFYWLIPEFSCGFKILPSDCEEYQNIAKEVCDDYGLNNNAIELFSLLGKKPDGSPICNEPLNYEIANAFWSKLQLLNYIDFPNIIYYSYKLLHQYEYIAKAIASRFIWFLIDEFQDTSALQVEIFKIIYKYKYSRFFLVGDPNQSIYRFAGASPSLMYEFGQHISARDDFQLLGNFRSHNSIIKCAERLIPRNPPMYSECLNLQYSEDPVYIPAISLFDAIYNQFIPSLKKLDIQYGDSAILAPWWIKLYILGQKLRENNIPVYGPGSRPYKRSHLIAPFIEHICAYISSPNPFIIPKIEKELSKMIIGLEGKPHHRIFTHQGRVCVIRLIRKGAELNNNFIYCSEWLLKVAIEFGNILSEYGYISAASKNLMVESANDIINDIISRKIDISNLTINKLGLFSDYEHSIKLLTMHRAKGREFDAVAMIDLHEGVIPNYRCATTEDFEEDRRLFYVAMTRARRLLIFITDKEGRNVCPSRFLSSSGFDIIK